MAGLKKAFAAAHSCDERTARRHYNANSEKWQVFVAKAGMAAAEKLSNTREEPPTDAEAVAVQVLSPSSPAEVKQPAVARLPDSELSQHERIVKDQWSIYDQASKAWLNAFKAQDQTGALAFGLAVSKALDSYYRASERLDKWQAANRRVIPFEEFQTLQPIMEALFEMIRSFPAEIALEANPTNPSLARDAGQKWLAHRFGPAADSFLQKLQDATTPQQVLDVAA